MPSYEPITGAMLCCIHAAATKDAALHPSSHLNLISALSDWTRMGAFTSSHLSNYGQSKRKKSQAFATVPNVAAVGK